MVCQGLYPDGRIAELFLSSNKPGSPMDAIARDAVLTKDHDGSPATILGAALNAIAEAAG